MRRTCVIMDGSNLLYQQKGNFFVDPAKLVRELTLDSRLVHAAWYAGDDLSESPEKRIQQQNFRAFLRGSGISVVLKPVKDIKDWDNPTKVIRKANLDVEMTIDAVAMMPYIDHFILCTGDGDFAYLVNHLRANGKEVSVASFRSALAMELHNVAGQHYISLESLRPLIEKTRNQKTEEHSNV